MGTLHLDPEIEAKFTDLKARKKDFLVKLRKQAERERLTRSSGNKSDEHEHSDKLDWDKRFLWTVEQWEFFSSKRKPKSTSAGFKNHSDLAYMSYKKENSKIAVDKEKYAEAKEASNLLVQPRAIALLESVEALANSLKEANNRRTKRRRVEALSGLHIDERNRHFNLKLEREYGKDASD